MYYSLATTANMVALAGGVADDFASDNGWIGRDDGIVSDRVPVARAVRGVLVHPTIGESVFLIVHFVVFETLT